MNNRTIGIYKYRFVVTTDIYSKLTRSVFGVLIGIRTVMFLLFGLQKRNLNKTNIIN